MQYTRIFGGNLLVPKRQSEMLNINSRSRLNIESVQYINLKIHKKTGMTESFQSNS